MRRVVGLASVGVITLSAAAWFISRAGNAETGISSAPIIVASSRPTPSVAPSPPPAVETTNQGGLTPYQRAIDAAASRGLEVWIDVDLAQRWLEGSDTFATTVRRLGPLVERPGVVGIKIADELGYQDGFTTSGQVRAFLKSSAMALRKIAPAKEILVDLLVPELGCAPGIPLIITTSLMCQQQQRARYPAISLSNVDGYVRSGFIDVVDLSTDLLPESTYASWGISSDRAQSAAWREVNILHWSRHVTLHERHALAHPGRYSGTPADAQSAAELYAWIPLSQGASGINVWAWQQPEDGVSMRLMDPGLRPNALWRMLVRLQRQGVELYTSFSPTWTERGVHQDMAKLAEVFSGVLIAAGV